MSSSKGDAHCKTVNMYDKTDDVFFCLCYSVSEAYYRATMFFSLSFSIGTDRHDVPRELSFKIRWRYIATDKHAADMYCNSKVYSIVILSFFFLDDDMGSDHFRNVVHDQSRDYFVADILRFF